MRLGTPWRLLNGLLAMRGLDGKATPAAAVAHARRRFREERLKAVAGVPLVAAALWLLLARDGGFPLRPLLEAAADATSPLEMLVLLPFALVAAAVPVAALGYATLAAAWLGWRLEAVLGRPSRRRAD